MKLYKAKDFSRLVGIGGLSETLLKTHFTLYHGYVANSVKIAGMLETAEKETPEYNELKRRFGWEFNGMRLHELYFGNLTKNFKPIKNNSVLFKKLLRDFGGYENWEADFKATGNMRGIGWAILYYDKISDKLFNMWINEHDAGHPAGGMPLLVMDVFEHAFMPDRLSKSDYINIFFNSIDWKSVENRLK
ncbi:MAG: Fe-Mn family superoxide dismutase [Candidatus Nanoarchaeia archaeon]|nr:Fe-Mn family superoxide dismutase [Candidatus Nanoarchaeia archaeon]